MKKILLSIPAFFLCLAASAQYQTSEPRTWESIPPGAQKNGFGLNKSIVVQMDGDPEEEQVLLFTGNNGHYPYFDLFKCYYAIVGNYSREVKYVSDVFISTSRDLVVEDRNKDGRFEVYRKYMKDGKFTVDEAGNNLRTQWVYDTIEFKNPSK